MRQQVPEICAAGMPITREMFVTALAIEKHGDIGIARLPHDAPLGVNAAAERGMLLVAHEGVDFIDKAKRVGTNVHVVCGKMLGNRANVGALIQGRIVGTGGREWPGADFRASRHPQGNSRDRRHRGRDAAECSACAVRQVRQVASLFERSRQLRT